MSENPVLSVTPLGFPWQTPDPFLFCAWHNDRYPAGDDAMAPATGVAGRRIGMDFSARDGWSMYHGDTVPGFPRHPHRGFETITIARRGLVDHADSMGATARFGAGDVQWMTAGAGVVHSEMFPLVHSGESNPLEIFQVWLNLPRADKMTEPHFTMFWNENVSEAVFGDVGARTRVRVVAGRLGDTAAPAPPPSSWASRAESDIAIWTIAMEPGSVWTLPAAGADSQRALYFFEGDHCGIAGRTIPGGSMISVRAGEEIEISSGSEACEFLLLQGRPIGEPVAHQGPFVMNTPAELRQAMLDYHTTGFGGWPWPSDAPVHPRERGRFAQHADGRVETPG